MSVLNDLNIPHMGSVENARIGEWRVAEGQAYAIGDILYEVETDKVATEVTAPEPGILVRQLAGQGDEHKVGDRIGLWAKPGTTAAAIAAALAARDADATPTAATQAATGAATPRPAPGAQPTVSGETRLSPLVRKLAAEHGVDLATVAGTGPGGRITGDDVLAARTMAPTDAYASLPVEKVPHSLRRKTITRRLTEAAAVPSLTADMQIDMEPLLARREQAKAAGTAASVLAYVAHAAVRLLAGAHRRLNATYAEDAAHIWGTVNLGIAVDTADGLIVPVVRNAETLDAPALGRAIAELAEKARSNMLAAADLEGGTFTISNPGSLGPTIRAEALLNVPQVALIGLPGMVRSPVAVERDGIWEVEVRRILRPSLTFDHRALDGGTVIAFLNDLKADLEAR